MATPEELAADRAAIDAYRKHYGEEAAALFAAEIYKMRVSQQHAPGGFYGFPRFAVVLIALWLALLETADKLPKLFLAFPAYEATLAELHAKMMQPDLMRAQVEKAHYEADAMAYAPVKALAEAKAARWQPSLVAAQGYAAQMQWLNGVPNDEWRKDGNLAITMERPDGRAPVSPDAPPRLVSPGLADAGAAIQDQNARFLRSFDNAVAVENGNHKSEPTPEPTPTPIAAPSPTPTALRMPTLFHCDRASMGVDYVICAHPKLLDAEARLEDAYQAAHAARGDVVKAEQREWIAHYSADCGLPLRGRPSQDLIEKTDYCVGGALERRIRELQGER